MGIPMFWWGILALKVVVGSARNLVLNIQIISNLYFAIVIYLVYVHMFHIRQSNFMLLVYLQQFHLRWNKIKAMEYCFFQNIVRIILYE